MKEQKRPEDFLHEALENLEKSAAYADRASFLLKLARARLSKGL